MKTISSLHNETIKSITGLIEKGTFRKKSKVFVVERKRELQLANKGGFTIDTIFCCQSLFTPSSLEEWHQKLSTSNIVLVTETVYENKLSYKNRGIIGL